MATEKQIIIHAHTPFTLTLSDNSKKEFGVGRHTVSEEVAQHWFTQAHAELSDEFVKSEDDMQKTIDALKAQIEEQEAIITALSATNSQAPDSGKGGKNAKESKPTHSK